MRRSSILVLVAAVSFGGSAQALAPGWAAVDAEAVRDIAVTVESQCDLETATAIAARHPDTDQIIVVATDSWASTTGTVEVVARDRSGRWRCQHSASGARFGRAGTRLLLERRSGDDTTPAGVFPLGEVTAWDGDTFSMFGNQHDPGVRAPYRDVDDGDCWGATPNTPDYQHLVNRPGCPGPDDEWLRGFGEAYSHAAVIGANLDPISGDEPGEPPYAAAIFLHRHAYGADGTAAATSGCVSLGADDLVATLRLIDPELRPVFAIGPTDWLRSTA